jgi:cytoskeletal protein CcmA (bactofilin family)
MKTKKQFSKKMGLMLFAFALTLLLAVTVTPTAHAGEFIEGKPDAALEEGETVKDDLFIGGDSVLVAGTVEGDLFAAGNDVVISGEVYGNVFTAGQTITVSGTIDGALMIAGYDLTLTESAVITRNVYFGGFSLKATTDSLVQRSIYGGGYQLILDGTVARDVTAGLGALQVAGPVGGDLNVEIGEPSSDSEWMVDNWMQDMPTIKVLDPGYEVEESLVEGDLNIKVTPFKTNVNVPEITIKDTLLKAVDEVKTNAGQDSLWGLLVYFLYVPVVFTLFVLLTLLIIMVSLLTLGSLAGEMIALSSFSFFGLLTLFGMLASLGTKIVVGYLVGRWLLGKTSNLSYENYWHHVSALAIGVFLYEVLRAVPVAGFFLMLIVVVIGTGAFFVLFKDALRKKSSSASEAEVVPA